MPGICADGNLLAVAFSSLSLAPTRCVSASETFIRGCKTTSETERRHACFIRLDFPLTRPISLSRCAVIPGHVILALLTIEMRAGSIGNGRVEVLLGVEIEVNPVSGE